VTVFLAKLKILIRRQMKLAYNWLYVQFWLYSLSHFFLFTRVSQINSVLEQNYNRQTYFTLLVKKRFTSSSSLSLLSLLSRERRQQPKQATNYEQRNCIQRTSHLRNCCVRISGKLSMLPPWPSHSTLCACVLCDITHYSLVWDCKSIW